MKFFAECSNFTAEVFDCAHLCGDELNDGICPLWHCLVFLCRLSDFHSFFDWNIVVTGWVFLWVLGIVSSIFHKKVNRMPTEVFGIEDVTEGFIKFADARLGRVLYSIIKDV